MGLFDFFKGSNHTSPITKLKDGSKISIHGVTYTVLGKLTYKDNNLSWRAYHLGTENANKFLSFEEVENGLYLGLYESIETKIKPGEKEVNTENTTYALTANGTAKISVARGDTGGIKFGDNVNYYTYESNDYSDFPYLSVEDFGDVVGVSRGVDLTEEEIIIL